MFHKCSAVILVALIYFQSSYAGFSDPLRDPEQLNKPKAGDFRPTVVKLEGVRVAVKDVELIKKDFPETREMSDSQIDEWLIEHAGYVGKEQLAKGVIRNTNSAIRVTGKEIVAYRPQGYGRALVLPVGTSGLLDVKGVGAVDPRPGHHSHGLASLAEGLREYAWEHLVQKVFDDSGSGAHTVGTYAVLDAGFDLNSAEKDKPPFYSPAGLIVRQGHIRSTRPHAFIPTKDALKLEKILRSYGITTAVTLKDPRIPEPERGAVLNLQGSDRNAIVDFGSFFVLPTFNERIVLCREDRALRKEKGKPFKVLMDPKDPGFIWGPEPRNMIPPTVWGSAWHYDQVEGVWTSRWAEIPWEATTGLAREFRAGTKTEMDVGMAIYTALRMVDSYWACARISPPPIYTPPPEAASTRTDSMKSSSPVGASGDEGKSGDPAKSGTAQ